MEPIEPHVRDETPPTSTTLVVRGGPVTVEKVLQAARREQAVYTWRDKPLACVSVEAVTEAWPLERLLAEHLATRSTYATTTVADVLRAGLILLPTFDPPHYDVVLEEASPAEAARFMSILSQPIVNPHKRRGRA
jgi:hypothetical protein